MMSLLISIVSVVVLCAVLFGLLFSTVVTIGKLLELDDLKHDDKHVDEIKIEVENEK